MENQLPQTNMPTIWETNPKLKTLLLVLIFVFLLSGIGLTAFSVWGNNYRQKVYEETKAGLPVHAVRESESQSVGKSDWKTYRGGYYSVDFPPSLSSSENNSTLTITFPSEIIGTDKQQKGIYDNLKLTISVEDGKNFVDTANYVSELDYNKNLDLAKLWNFKSYGYESLNGIDFYKYSWVHQNQVEVYVAIHNNKLFKISITAGSEKDLKEFNNYVLSKQILTTFKINN